MLKLTTDRHEASRGLSATTELLDSNAIYDVGLYIASKCHMHVQQCRHELRKLITVAQHVCTSYSPIMAHTICVRPCDFYRAILCKARKLFYPTGSHMHHSSFSVRHGMAIFRKYHLTGASNARGVRKNRDFRPISRFVSQMIQDRGRSNVNVDFYSVIASNALLLPESRR